jgi:hypothetical protein
LDPHGEYELAEVLASEQLQKRVREGGDAAVDDLLREIGRPSRSHSPSSPRDSGQWSARSASWILTPVRPCVLLAERSGSVFGEAWAIWLVDSRGAWRESVRARNSLTAK